MADITVRIEGVSALIAALEAKRVAVDRATFVATDQSGRLLQNDARRNFQGSHAPGFYHVGGDQPNTVTGNLQNSIQYLTPTHKEGLGTYSNRSGPQMVYSRVIEIGAHITPKVARLLAWFDAEAGHVRTMHEATIPPRPYFSPARFSLPPKMQSIFYSNWSNAWST